MFHYSWEWWALGLLDRIFFECGFSLSGPPISSFQSYGLFTELCLNVLSIIGSAYCNLSLFRVSVYFSSPVNVCFIDLDALSTNSSKINFFYHYLCFSLYFIPFFKFKVSLPGVCTTASVLLLLYHTLSISYFYSVHVFKFQAYLADSK